MKLARPISVNEVATAADISRVALNRIELNQTERIDFDILEKLCRFYSGALERPITPGDILEYDPNKEPAYEELPV